jgi:putative heme-binding domain-containing protein
MHLLRFKTPLGALTLLLILACCLEGCKTNEADDSKTSGPLFSQDIRTTEARTPEEELLGFKLPPGFEIQLFASEPDIDKPINLTFDAKGRMWVTQSFEYPFPAVPGAKGTDKLTILEDINGDGKADKFTSYLDTLNIPIGILPITGGAIAYSVPNVYKFVDANNDDKPESKSTMLGPFGFQDTHGMVSNFIRGYDGWVHACHGFTNKSSVAGSDGDSIHLVSGNTFRFRMDGSRVEQSTFGQVNPFGLAYDELGYIYSTDSHSSPLYQLIQGGDYPHFGKVEIMGFAPDMKPLINEATALAGIAYYGDVKFPQEFQKNLFIGDVVNSRVHRYSGTWKGSSPVGKSEIDFVKSEDPWFRPVNIKLGPDGALYVADFYNAIIGHYEVPLNHPKRDKRRGRIWKITYKGDTNQRVDLEKSTVDELIASLDADNLTLRMAATDQITDRIGSSATEALKQKLSEGSTSPRKYIHAMWALHRLNALSDDILKASAGSKESLIRLHALRVLAEKKPDPSYLELANNALKDTDPNVQRAAVELLMKYPSVQSVEELLTLLTGLQPGFDTHLIYTARLALRNILRREEVLKAITARKWDEQAAGFMAGVMVDVPSTSSALFLQDYMSKYTLPKERIAPAYKQIVRFLPKDQVASTIDKALNDKSYGITMKSMVFKALTEGIAQREGKVDPKIFAKYAPGLAEEILKKYPASDLTDSEEKVNNQRVAIDIAGDYKVKLLEPALTSFLEQGHKLGMGIRAAALRSLMKIDLEKNVSLAANILEKDSMIEYQRRIGGVLGEFPGSAVNKMMEGLKTVAPELQGTVALALAGSPAGKDILFNKIKRGEVLPRVLLEPRVEERVLSNATKQQEKEFAALTANVEPISKEKQETIEKRLAAFEALNRSSLNLDSGRMVFEQNCGVCHKTSGTPGIAPQLAGVGKRGPRGLMEKILDPNRNISQAFQNYNIRLKDGTLKSGLYRRDEGEVKVFADLTGKEFSVAKKDIAELKALKYTLMPDAFSSSISETDFDKLINYLLSI